MPRFLPALRGKTLAVSLEAKAVYSDYYSALWQYENQRRARPWPVERAVTEGYERVIWVFKAVNTIGADSARLPFRLRQDDEVLDDHPLYRVLNKKANPLESGQVFRKRLSAQILLSKAGAFVEKTTSRGGDIVRLDLLPPDRTLIVPGRGSDLVSHVRLQRRDGSYRDIDWENVLWFRDPHPLDPYSGVTPLESAGMSVELDYFARLYNVSFMRNDGRPGGVLAVRGPNGETADMDEKQMDRIESRFGKGPVEAGKLSVIAGELSYVDLATRPRDMQYGSTSRNSKIELLSAFGVPETVLGYSAERTYSNADSEMLNYWTRTMPAHNEIIVAGFDEDSGDDLTAFLDTSSVEVLEAAERAKRDEARTEFDKGLRSILSYAQLAGYADEIDDTAHTRALYIASGRTPLPSREEDAVALGLAPPIEATAPPPESEPAPLEGGEGGAAAGEILPGDTEPPPGELPPGGGSGGGGAGGGAGGGGDAASILAAASQRGGAGGPAGGSAGGGDGARALAAAQQGKSARGPVLRVVGKRAPTPDERTSDPDQRARDRLEDTIAAALTALATRWTERAIARLESPKARRGTRHWAPDGPYDTRLGNKALDAPRAVDEESWSREAETGTEPIVVAAAVAAALALYAELSDDDDEDSLTGRVRRLVGGVVGEVVGLVSRSAGRQAAALIRLINRADQDGRSLQQIIGDIRATARLTAWAEGIAAQVATATVNGARDAAAADVAETTGDDIRREWYSRRDARVRDSHEGADGQTQPLHQPFVVGESLLMYPGDPSAPVGETANCRCWLRHRSVRTGRFVPAPLDATLTG